jgi:hypothetical protein
MTTYEMVREHDRIFDAWAVIAVSLDGRRRYVSRYMTQDQAQTMMDRLSAMMAAQVLTD